MQHAMQPANEIQISKLLEAIIEEMHLLSCEIVLLGDGLTIETVSGAKVDTNKYLQNFDALSQRAFANVQLLQTYQECLDGKGATVHEIVDAMPFHEIRERLFEKILGQKKNPESEAVQESEVDFF